MKEVNFVRKNKNNGKGFKEAEENDYNIIGRKVGHLTVMSLVPKDKCANKNHGRYWLCKCDCGNETMVPTSYLCGSGGKGSYKIESCGCLRKIRHFMQSAKWDVEENWLMQFLNDWDKFSYVNFSLLKAIPVKDNPDKKSREHLLEHFYYDKQFNAVYSFWKIYSSEKEKKTFYDLAKPSPDHIIPKSRGGKNEECNIHFITVFENLAKRDMTWDEWQSFKKDTNTRSDFFIEDILKKQGVVL